MSAVWPVLLRVIQLHVWHGTATISAWTQTPTTTSLMCVESAPCSSSGWDPRTTGNTKSSLRTNWEQLSPQWCWMSKVCICTTFENQKCLINFLQPETVNIFLIRVKKNCTYWTEAEPTDELLCFKSIRSFVLNFVTTSLFYLVPFNTQMRNQFCLLLESVVSCAIKLKRYFTAMLPFT